MDIQSVIDRLARASNSARSLDPSIGELMGWTKQIELITDPKSGEPKRIVQWLSPTGGTGGEPPKYTFELQAAYELAQQIAPGHVGGFAWEEGKGKAQIADGPRVEAHNPQIALCIAALKCLQTKIKVI